MEQTATIVWFRRDLRLADNPALAALESGTPVIPLFIWSPESEGDWGPGGATKWWLHHSLEKLSQSLLDLGAPLVIRKGEPLQCLLDVVKESGAKRVHWNRLYEPALIERDKKIKTALQREGLEVHSFNAALLVEPWEILNSSKKPFQVFTPYWKKLSSGYSQAALAPAPKSLTPCASKLNSQKLESLDLLPEISWYSGFETRWEPGEDGAAKQLNEFLSGAISDYPDGRNIPGKLGTSRLSPYLHFGEIGPRQVWQAVDEKLHAKDSKLNRDAADCYLREIGWREFAHHLLFHFPYTPTKPLREEFSRFPWKTRGKALKAWQKGLTGYPIVDAGMRELWRTGWMHNRVRMIVASFLVKDLLVPWQEGAKWFWDTLVDADLANNTLGWQWTAGCGADAAPFFRVFNPFSQGVKFDPKGDYVREFVPEISRLPDQYIHAPWEAPDDVLERAKVVLGETYPHPIVDHAEAREIALEAYSRLRGK